MGKVPQRVPGAVWDKLYKADLWKKGCKLADKGLKLQDQGEKKQAAARKLEAKGKELIEKGRDMHGAIPHLPTTEGQKFIDKGHHLLLKGLDLLKEGYELSYNGLRFRAAGQDMQLSIMLRSHRAKR